MLRKAVFLDRDGVVNVCPGVDKFVLRWSEFRFMPGLHEQLARLRAAGFFLALITNQSGIGRGLMTLDSLSEIHTNMQSQLGAQALDAIYYCPHHPDAGCVCRKPSPEMIRRACNEHGLDPRASFMIGDSGRDIHMGRDAGCRTILCRQDLPALEKLKPEHVPDRMEKTIKGAVDWILAQK